MITLAATLMGCCAKKPHYESVNDYPVKQGSLTEMTYSPEKTTFSVWSPNADTVYLNLYADATTAEPLQTLTMCRQKDGSWTKTVKGDLNGQFYTFLIVEPSSRWTLHETPGIFAKAVGVNGRRAAIIDLAATNPEGWEKDKRPELKSAATYVALMDELEGSENRIATARKDYNDTVKAYNNKIIRFPANIFAGIFGFQKADYFEADEGAKDAPDVGNLLGE